MKVDDASPIKELRKACCDSAKVLQLALPYDHYAPAGAPEFPLCGLVTPAVGLQLVLPPLGTTLGESLPANAVVSVPETAVHEDDCAA